MSAKGKRKRRRMDDSSEILQLLEYIPNITHDPIPSQIHGNLCPYCGTTFPKDHTVEQAINEHTVEQCYSGLVQKSIGTPDYDADNGLPKIVNDLINLDSDELEKTCRDIVDVEEPFPDISNLSLSDAT